MPTYVDGRGGVWTENSCTIHFALHIISLIPYITDLKKVHHTIAHSNVDYLKSHKNSTNIIIQKNYVILALLNKAIPI